MKDAVVQHIVSVAGQLAAAIPPIVLMIVLSRVSGLESAGRFAVIVGVGAAVFSIAYWGMRTAIVRDRFETAEPATYTAARILALVLAASVVVSAGLALGVSATLTTGLVLYRVCDGLLDLDFAVTQVGKGTHNAIHAFARQHLAKLALVIGAMAIAVVADAVSIEVAYATSGIIGLVFVGTRVLARVWCVRARTPSIAGVVRVFQNAAWFAAAVGTCALLSSAPRFSLGWFYNGDTLGVVGVSLSASTFLGMAFYTAWVRHMPRFDNKGSYRRAAGGFLIETMLIALAAVLATWLFLPELIGLVFAYDRPEQLTLTSRTLMVSVIFFAGMNLCNLFKVTIRPWLEAGAYLVALVVAILTALAVPDVANLHVLMVMAGITMFVFGASALAMPYKANKSVTVDAGTTA